MPNLCADIEIKNLKKLKFPKMHIFRSYSKDHSKWAMGEAKDGKKHICIGDTNRMVCSPYNMISLAIHTKQS